MKTSHSLVFTTAIMVGLMCFKVQARSFDIDYTSIKSISGIHSGGTLQIVYCDNNSTPKQARRFVRPLIIVEGYDPHKVLGDNDITIEAIDTVMLKEIKKAYDIIFLNYNDGVDDIFCNARLLEAAIDTVNSRKVGTEQNVVVGVSMGGLVARYCLASMEKRYKDHQTRKYISLDVPHRGANVPVGFQAAIRDLRTLNVTVFRQTIDPMQQHLKAQLHF